MKFGKPAMLLAGCSLLSPLAVQAEEAAHPKLAARVYLDVGAYRPGIDTKLRVDRAGGQGTVISLEDDLDYDDSEVLPYGMVNLRLGERWRIEGEYFALDRDKTRVIDREIQIGDSVFPLNETVRSHFDTDIYRLSVGYSFLKWPSSEAGVALGVHVTSFDLGISTEGTIIRVSEAAETFAPLPTLGLYGYHAFSPRWLVQGRADLFSLDYDDYSGSLVNISLGLEYQLAKHVGIGAGYRYVDLELTSEKTLPVVSASDDFRGEFNYHYSGPTLYMSLSY